MTKEEAIETIKDICLTTKQLERVEKALECLLSTPSLPPNLDEAAEKNFETMEVLEHENIFEETHNRIFKAGAEWMNKQMKMPNSTKLISEWHNVKTILEEKDFRGDEWRLAYNAFMFGFSRGINTQKTEK